MSEKILTSEEYRENDCSICPVCKSNNISGDRIEADCDYALQNVTCNDCWSHWTDCYKLMGYEDLVRGDQ